MRRGARALRAVACGVLLAAGATPLAAQARPPTLCERPARPPAPAKDAKVHASFHAFASAHLAKLRKAGALPNAPGGRRTFREDFELELRPTGSKQAPWVGVLRYCEQALRCSGASAASCTPWKNSVVTEIFRFQGGKWVY